MIIPIKIKKTALRHACLRADYLLQYAWRATQVQVLGYWIHEPTHDVAPSAVSIADAIDAIS